jgi:hypothetical protein
VLDDRSKQATDALNEAPSKDKCRRVQSVMQAERALLQFVEEYQVICVLDAEIVAVQRRRWQNAVEARRRVCIP